MKSRNWSLKQRKYQKAFSLLEVLIASTIFSVVLVVASSAFKFFMSMGSRTINSEVVMQESMQSINLRAAIKGLQHYYIRESAMSTEVKKLFFRGEKEGLTGITTTSLDFAQQPTRITVSKWQDKSKQWHLVYCEYDNRSVFPLAYIESTCEKPRIIASNVKKVDFSYFGWSSLDTLYGQNSQIKSNLLFSKKSWQTPWYASQKGILPQYVKVAIEYEEGVKGYQPTQLWFHISDADPAQLNINSVSYE